MTRANDLVPLLESTDESPEVLSLIRSGAAHEVSDYDFEGGLSAHLGAITAPPAAATAGSQAASGGALSAKALVAAIGLPLASVSVAAALWLGQSPEPGASARSTAPAVVAPRPSPAEQPPEDLAPAAEPGAVAPLEDLAEASGASPAMPQPGRVRNAPHRAARGAALPAPAAEGPTIRVTLDETGDDVRPEVAQAPPGRSTSTSSSPVAEPPEESEAEAEARRDEAEEARERAKDRLRLDMEQLMEAKRALSRDPRRALELTRRGEQEFPDSVLGQERRHVLILALIGVGRRDEARRLAAPYLEQHPDSPFAVRIRKALQAEPPRAPR